MGDSAVILAQIRTAIDCKDSKCLLNTIISERFADIDSYWELVSMLGRCITSENSKTSSEFFAASRDCLKYLVSNGNAKELLLALLEQIDETTEDVKFKVYMQLLQTTLLKLSVKRLYSLELVLVSLSDHILQLPCLDDGSKLGEEHEEMEEEENEHRKTVSAEEIRISDLLKAYLEFLHPFIYEVSIAHRNEYKGDNLLGQLALLVKHLVSILGQPLINFDLSNCRNKKHCMLTSRSCAEAIVQDITALRPNIQSVLEELVHLNTSLERKLKVRQASRHVNPIKNDDSDDNGDIEDEKIIPVLALSNLSYLLNVEKFGMASFPCVYNHTYLLQFNLSFVSHLLLNKDLYVIQKGICLLQVTVTKVLPGTLDHFDLEYPYWFIVLDALIQVMTGCASKTVRQACIRLLPPFIDIFTSKERYKIFEKIFKTYYHSGVIGYVIQLFKNQIEKELRSSNPCDQFLGASMYKLLSEVARLPDGAKTRLLDHSDQLISVLNFVRYLLLCDSPSQNITGIWNRYGELEQAFLNPLRQCLDLTKETFQMELKDVQHNQTQKMSEVEFGVSVGDKMLPEMTKEEKINMLNLALRTFDVMESVLCRVFEIVDQQRKAIKNVIST